MQKHIIIENVKFELRENDPSDGIFQQIDKTFIKVENPSPELLQEYETFKTEVENKVNEN